MAVEVGQPVPDMTLVSNTGENIALSSYKGNKHLVVAFIVLAFTGG